MLSRELKGRYRIIKELGAGGFGKTYIAEDTHRPGLPHCVVKQLMPISKDLEFLQMARRLFKMEAEVLEKLGHHEQIPQLLAYFEENKEFYLIEEFIEGECFKDRLFVENRQPEFEVINLLKDILKVLIFIHEQSVIHRDIKPSNIIKRKKDGRFVLIDFGAVKQIQPHVLREQGNVTLTTLTIAIGTTNYAPLEQLAGQPRLNSDIYSLGIVAIQALTGLLPSKLKRDSQTGVILWRHLTQVREELADIIDKMTHPTFEHRYQSAIVVLQDLESLTYIQPVNTLTTAPTITSTSLPQTAFSPSISFLKQYAQLEEILREFVGAISPILVQKYSTQVASGEELIEKLLPYVTQKQRSEFQRMAIVSLQKPAVSKESIIKPCESVSKVVGSKPQTIDDSFLRRCEQELTDLIGPMGVLLVQKAIKSHPQFSCEEFVEFLVAKISNPHKADEFRQRLFR